MFPEIPKNCRYGYARVSSKSQKDNSSLEAQKEEFRKLGVPEKNIRTEVGSAADPIRERPIFQKLIDQELQENDLLLVTKIDRCSRNTLKFLKLQEKLFQKSVRFIALDLPLLKTNAGKNGSDKAFKLTKKLGSILDEKLSSPRN